MRGYYEKLSGGIGINMAMKRKKITSSLILLFCLLLISCGCYVGDYYRSTDEAEEYAKETEQAGKLNIKEIEGGLLIDGPGSENALIFYPGAKVEYSAYLPLLCELAEEGMDVFLIRMPANLAILGADKADDILESYSYANWYIGGHSLGGAMAANYAADFVPEEKEASAKSGQKKDNDTAEKSKESEKSEGSLKGLILLAAYPTKDLSESGLKVLTIYGSEDSVLSREKLEEGRKYLPKDAHELVIEGGNHAQFGCYGEQKGDGKASVSAEKQREQTVEAIVELLNKD